LLNLNKPISILEKRSFQDIREHKTLDLKKLQFRSKKFVIEKDKVYPGKAAYKNGMSIDGFSAAPIPIIDCQDFWDELDFFWVTESV